MWNKRTVQLNNVINILIIVVVILAIITGYWTYTNKDTVEDLHKKVIQTIQPENNFKTIEVSMYDQTTEKMKNILVGTKKVYEGKTTAEITHITNSTTKTLNKIFGSNQIKETQNFDMTITIKLLIDKEYFEEHEIKIGKPITIDFGTAFLNGTIQTVK